MARRSRMSVQKRKRERDKAERAALKREERLQQRDGGEDDGGRASAVATEDDLEGYGLAPEPDAEQG